MMKNKLDHLKLLAEDDFDGACVWAENNIESLKDYLDTWAKHCGAPRDVFVGQTVVMLINVNDDAS